VIETFKDRNPTLTYIEAIIIISKDSQKGILLGKGGERIKDMATKSRQKLEAFLDRKVYLEMKVKVIEDWRSNKDALMKFGYIETDDS
jgi:GTP-binding protein Era